MFIIMMAINFECWSANFKDDNEEPFSQDGDFAYR